MAAAEYYNPGGQQPPGPQGPQFAPPAQANPNPPYPMSDAPPPYSEYAQPPPRPFAEQRPQSQPPPQQRPPNHDPSRPPPPANGSGPGYPPDKSGRPPPGVYRPSDLGGQYPPQPYQQQPPPSHQYPPPQGYFPLAGSPAMQQVYGNGNPSGRRPSTTPGLRPPRQSSRPHSRSRSRSRHRKHQHRPQVQRKKSSGVNTFLGAGGGAILGDAIFPGLGTLSGAILGGLGGHEYGKKRAHSNPSRAKGRSYSNDGAYPNEEYRRGRRH